MHHSLEVRKRWSCPVGDAMKKVKIDDGYEWVKRGRKHKLVLRQRIRALDVSTRYGKSIATQ